MSDLRSATGSSTRTFLPFYNDKLYKDGNIMLLIMIEYKTLVWMGLAHLDIAVVRCVDQSFYFVNKSSVKLL